VNFIFDADLAAFFDSVSKDWRAKLEEVKKALRKHMHQPIPEQGHWLGQVVRGYFAYHAVPTTAHDSARSATS
jgi:hypothetical protein